MNKKKGLFSIGFYWRKFTAFWVVAFFVILAISQLNFIRADSEYDYSGYGYGVEAMLVEITDSGQVVIDGKTKGYLKSYSDFDELRLPVLSKPGTYLDSFEVTVKLPGSYAYSVDTDVYGIHGVGKVENFVGDSNSIIYEAKDIGPMGEFSIAARLPKGIVEYPYQKIINDLVLNLAPQYWVVIAVILPLLTLLLMLNFLYRQFGVNKLELPKTANEAPPMSLPPAIVGVLYRQKVTGRELAATIIDLAIKKNIYVIDRERDFGFAKNNDQKQLLGYEKILLSKLFRNNIFSNQEEIEKRINNHLYSRKISLVSAGMYAIATRLGYFKANPQSFYLKYRLVGSAFFIVGVLGLALQLFWFKTPEYAIFFWVGMMISALVMIFSVSKVSMRSDLGTAALSDWLAFKNYLSDKRKIEYTPDVYELFIKYLPYALVMDCEVAWARRFSEHNFVVPDWFITDKAVGLQDFCLQLFPLISYVSQSFAATREPGFD